MTGAPAARLAGSASLERRTSAAPDGAGPDPAGPVTMYIRLRASVLRQALGQQVLGYALGQPGVSQDAGYRGLFGRMGFE